MMTQIMMNYWKPERGKIQKKAKKKVAHHWHCTAMQSQSFFSVKEAVQDTRVHIKFGD